MIDKYQAKTLHWQLPDLEPLTYSIRIPTSTVNGLDAFTNYLIGSCKRRPATQDDLMNAGLIGVAVEQVVVFWLHQVDLDYVSAPPPPEDCELTDASGVSWIVKSIERHQTMARWECTCQQAQVGQTGVTGEVPAAPTSLTATALSATTIGLAWTDTNAGFSAYLVERSPDGVSQWRRVGQTLAGGTAFTDTGLVTATHYFYQVFSVQQGVLSATAATANATTM